MTMLFCIAESEIKVIHTYTHTYIHTMIKHCVTTITYSSSSVLVHHSKLNIVVPAHAWGNKLKGHCIEFKYYADGIHSGLRVNNS